MRTNRALRVFWVVLLASLALAACKGAPVTPVPKGTASIQSVAASTGSVPRFGMLELTVALSAEYQNPLDERQVSQDAVFTAPGGKEWKIPGFWDGKEGWRVRFTPSSEGEWRYAVRVTDKHGLSQPVEGKFTVTPSDSHGWLQVANWVDPAQSKRYLAYKDGAPFYGIGRCNAFDLLSGGFDAQKGVALFDTMRQHGENMVVWWPIYSNPFFNSSYDDYSYPDLKVIDTILSDAEKKGIFLVFTVWAHPMLRAEGHPWGQPEWERSNGFRKLGDVNSFFTGAEAWAWQENLYRYIIARWGYSKAIGLWMTVSEIEGTSVGSQKDTWHAKINDYFATHDPYRHPITASMAGDQWWPAGYAVMDFPQIHSYNTRGDPVGTGPEIGGWTRKMAQAQEKPNFIGEFGSTNSNNYPELNHNGLWAALASGAAATPMKWNDSGSWGRMSDETLQDMARFSKFAADLPLAKANPTGIEAAISGATASTGAKLAVSAIGSQGLAVAWVQDVTQSGMPIETVRQNQTIISGANILIPGLAAGKYRVRVYDTWQGVYVMDVVQVSSGSLTVALPDFKQDIAVRVERADGG